MTRSTTVLLLLACGAALTACNQTPRYRPPPGSLEDPLPVANYPNINVHRPLTQYILVADPIATRDDLGTLRIDTPIRANVRPNEDLNLQYKYQFLDAQGRVLQPEPAWQYIRVAPTIQYYLTANSMDDRAADWRLEIMPAR
ncbi:MAG: DUF1425 domain-containing protein [Phycisphaerales bacterium]|nr:DUF1425 domain-containing protein [Phycisphaerales bacterium]